MDFIENCEDYMEWMFPNYSQSPFNKSSFPLKFQECQLMKSDDEIAQKIFLSYKMQLDFYGFEMRDIRTGVLSRKTNYKKRYYKALLKIARILTTLNLTGFRRYAVELVRHLEREMYGPNQEGIYQAHFGRMFKAPTTSKIKAPLCDLRKFNPMKKWWFFGAVERKNERLLL